MGGWASCTLDFRLVSFTGSERIISSVADVTWCSTAVLCHDSVQTTITTCAVCLRWLIYYTLTEDGNNVSTYSRLGWHLWLLKKRRVIISIRGINMFSRLHGLNTWLQRSCGLKWVNFIDNFNIFWGHRQLFKLDGLHLNRLGARVLKDNIYFSLHHPLVMFANPLCLNGTHTPGQSISDHRTSFQLQSHHVAHTSHKDTDNTMQQNTRYLDNLKKN